MGYTHFWRKPKELDAEKFKEFASDVKKIIELAEKNKGIVIKGGNGKGSYEITDEYVSFNGDRERGYDGERFEVNRVEKKELNDVEERLNKEDGTTGLYFKFCKTLLNPYDVVVAASLISLKYRFPEVLITSRSMQMDGVRIAEKVLGLTFGDIEKILLKKVDNIDDIDNIKFE